MLISELIAKGSNRSPKSISQGQTLREMAAMLTEHNIGILVVLDAAGGIAGVASERDLARCVAFFGESTPKRTVGEIMTTKVITARPEDGVLTTLQIMTDAKIRHIPVVVDGKPRAMLSLRQFEVAYKELLAQSRTDHLTGLANRRHFVEELEQELSRKQRFGSSLSLAMIDLDDFKRINQAHGNNIGDDVIRAMADLLKQEFRDYDEIGRLGGEEFAVLFPNTDLASARIACERVIKAVRACRVKTEDGREISFSASFGLYQSLGEDESSRRVLKYADMLLSEAKAAGRDCIVAGDGQTDVADGSGDYAAAAAPAPTQEFSATG